MNSFIVRVALTYSFAQEKMTDLGSFWRVVLSNIPEQYKPQLFISRFTFGTYYLEADTKATCKQIIHMAWCQVFGDPSGISDILISKYTEAEDDDTSKLIRTIYNNYYGAEEYQSMITDLTETIPMLRERNALDVLINQNYLFSIDSGSGFSTLLSSFGDYLRRMKVYPEEENDKRTQFIEYIVGSESGNGYNTPDDIMESLYNNMEENEYGVIGFDISQYLEGKKFNDLRHFIKRLSRYQDKNVFVFKIPFLEKRALDDIIGLISDIILLKSVQIPPLHECILIERAWDVMTSKDYEPNPDIIEILRNKIALEKKDGRFYGFKSAEKITYELIIAKSKDNIEKEAVGQEISNVNIIADDLKKYSNNMFNEANGYDALSELIGMEEITKKIREIIAQVKVSMTNKKLDRPCIHMRFTGAPGTGKTTVARILGQILREEGILRKGGFFEYRGRDLVAEYVGQTAVKTASICRDSYGSVLFIDEAYALYGGEYFTNDYGKEALTTLISEMENHRDDMLVIMAGYIDEMETLMKGNPGLRSRMPYLINFPNYTRKQLFEIFMLMVRKHFSFTKELEEEAEKYFMSLSDETLSSKEFANARFVRNLYERTWSKGALRCSLAGIKEIELIKDDFMIAKEEKEFKEKLEVKRKIGF